MPDTSQTNTANGTWVAMENLSGKVFIGDQDFTCWITEVSFWHANLVASESGRDGLYNSGCPDNLYNHFNYSATNLISWWRMGNGGATTPRADGGFLGPSNSGIIHDIVSNRDAFSTSDSNWGSILGYVGQGPSQTPAHSDGPIKVESPCNVGETIPFSFGIRGPSSLRGRSTPYKVHLD